MPSLLAAEPPKPVFALLLEVDDLTLRASLRNLAKTPQQYLYDRRLQPVTLKITCPSGKLTPVDRRANAKFDNTPYRHLYQALAPGASAPLLEATLGNNYLRWGEFVFDWSDEPKGTCHITASLAHQQNRWVDSETKQSGVFANLWRGNLISNTVAVKIS